MLCVCRAGYNLLLGEKKSRDTTTFWLELDDNPEDRAAFVALIQIGKAEMHDDPDRHDEWLANVNEVWKTCKADPVAYAAWHTEFMNATWRNNDHVLNRENSWYKVSMSESLIYQGS
jgi:hypothetical protein